MKKGLAIGAAIGLAAAAGVFVQQQVQRHSAPGSTPAAATAPAASDEPPSAIQPAPEEQPLARVIDTLPDFQLADRDGKKRSLKEWAGQPLMVNFWATWCPPCRKEIPLLNQLRKQRASQRLEIVGIAVDFRDDVLKYAQETAISYPLLIGEEDGMAAMKAFGMGSAGFPFTYFADSKQRIVALKVGELHQEEADLVLDRVMAVDAGKLDLAAARQQIDEGMKEIGIRRAKEKADKDKVP